MNLVGKYVRWTTELARENIWLVIEQNETHVLKCQLILPIKPYNHKIFNRKWSFKDVEVLSENDVKRIKLEAL